MTTTAMEDVTYGPQPMRREREGAGVATDQPAPGTDLDDISSRFLQFLIPAAATVASTFGPQIGSAVGGLIGGSSGAQAGGQIGGTVGGILGNLGGGLNLGGIFGGRDFADVTSQLGGASSGIVPPHLVDLTTPMVQQCTLQCLTQITPDLASMLKDLGPQLKTGDGSGRSAEAEIAAVERFWPDVASFLTQQVASHLPDIIKTVTSTVIPLLGNRDAAQYRPLLTGAEAHARWFIPVVTSVLTAVQQTLPHLLKALDGESRAFRDTGITWTDLATYGRFWDNDFIRVVGQEDLGDPGSVALVLELAPHLSWAKELQVRDDNGAVIQVLRVQDANKWRETSVAADQILTNGSLLFAKAKMFGIMTGMYVLPTAGMEQLRGKRTHIRWMSD